MKLDLMRRVDLWFGQPVCFMLTLVRRVKDFFSKKDQKDTSIKCILLIKLSEMGAIVLAYPLIIELRKTYPDAKIKFLTFSRNMPAFRLLNNIIRPEDIYTINEDSLSGLVFSALNVLGRIRREKVDTAIDLEFFSRFAAGLSFLCGARQRVGFYRYHFEGLYRGELLTHKVQYNPLIHCSVSYVSLGRALRVPYKNLPEFMAPIDEEKFSIPEFVMTAQAKEEILKRLKEEGIPEEASLYLINPGEGVLAIREWPLENYIALARRILRVPGRVVVVVGSNAVTGKDKALYNALSDMKCINFVGKTSIEDMLALVSIAKVLISNDCGLPHMTSLTACPRIVLFGPETPLVFGPLGRQTHAVYSNFPCSPCLSVLNHRQSSCQDNRCLKVITVDQVCDLVEKVAR